MTTTLIIILGLGIAIFLVGLSWQRKLNNYEFENMSDGGVIAFESSSAANRHEGNKRMAKLLINIGLIPAVAGVLLLAYGALHVVGFFVDLFSA
ncbi:MAG: hypothetical protein ACK4R8_06765 [Thiobacillus sp.]